MMKPKWQRARIIVAPRSIERHLIGREVWVKTERPQPFAGFSSVDGTPDQTTLCMESNLINEKSEALRFTLKYIELLARDESDFADERPPQLWSDFIKEPFTQEAR